MTQQNRKRLIDRKIVCYLMEKKGVREVRRLLGVGDRRIRKIRALAESYGYLNGNTPLPPYPEALFEDGPDGRASRSSEPDQLLLTDSQGVDPGETALRLAPHYRV